MRLGRAALAGLLLAAPASAEERIRVRLDDGEVQDLRLEDYVAGVVAGEMPASFPEEALKAQAVAARSYALTRKIEADASGKPWHLGAGVLAQVYRGQHSPAARAAALATAGEVLVHGVLPVEAYFHSSCGGRTESGAAALGRDLPYLASIACGFCDGAPGARWTRQLGGAELGKVAGLPGAADAVRVASRTASGRAERVEVARGERVVTLGAADLRQRLGWSRLPSLDFEVREVQADGDGFVLTGRGHGHGAGLCQHGAAGMARAGKTYREILAQYYPGADVARMY